MIRSIAARLGLAAALVVSFPAAVAAQAEEPTPEGVEWHLAGYAVDGEVAVVPWHIDATLLLEGGSASGSSGCNTFNGSYAREGGSLTFDPAFAMTRTACPDEQGAAEDGYMANLALTATWSIEDGILSLADADGEPLLDFEQTVIALTASDVSTLARLFENQQAQIDRLDERVDSIRIGTLRDRIKTLENQVKSLRAAASSSGSSTFTAAEKQLSKGIPTRIRRTCKPLRSGLPSGTLAAVRCQPASTKVDVMAYYLMPYGSAERTFLSVMRSHDVPERYRCDAGRPSQMLQSPYHATGCFVDDTGANVRLVTWAANCQQMDIGGKRVKAPATYVAIEGTGSRIKPLFEWAMTDDLALTPVWTNIPVSGNPPSPACEGLAL